MLTIVKLSRSDGNLVHELQGTPTRRLGVAPLRRRFHANAEWAERFE
jgi:hypothetical protein